MITSNHFTNIKLGREILFKMKKVVILIPNLCVGGGQKMVIEVVKHLISSDNLDFLIICLSKNNNTIFDNDAKKNGIKVIYLNKEKGLHFIFTQQTSEKVFVPLSNSISRNLYINIKLRN